MKEIVTQIENRMADFYKRMGYRASSIYLGHREYGELREWINRARPLDIAPWSQVEREYRMKFNGALVYKVDALNYLDVGG